MPSPVLNLRAVNPASALISLHIWGKLFHSRVLDFNMQHQTQSNWCWAATATSVSHYYWLWSTWTQCKVASSELGQTCCASPVPGACNVPWYLDKALTRTHNLDHMQGGTIAYPDIRSEIDHGRVIGTRIGWSGGGGHFMVIHGYTDFLGTQYVDIDDPIYGKSHLLLSEYTSNYQGSGSWTHTYYTKEYALMPFIPYLIPKELLSRIWEVRPLAKVKRGEFDNLEHADDAELISAQNVYTVGLDQLSKLRDLNIAPYAVRVVESRGDQVIGVYESNLADKEAKIGRVITGAEYLAELGRTLEQAATLTETSETPTTELRHVHIPALHIDAVWLHDTKSKQNRFIPVRSIGALRQGQIYNEKDFLQIAREAATSRAEETETMGGGGGGGADGG